MSEETSKRRPLLKVLGAGALFAIVPQSWVRPVVQSIVVPAHAQASPATTTGTTTTGTTTTVTTTATTTTLPPT